MDAIVALCERRGLALIEDCAQAYGVRYRGRGVGTFGGGIGCFSAHPLKVLSCCGGAGFLTVGDEAERDRLFQLRNLGLRDRNNCVVPSDNRRLHTIQAAMLLVKLDAVDDMIAARRAHADAYREAFQGLVTLPPADLDHRVIYSAFVIRHPDRDRLLAALHRRGVDAKVHYPYGIHQQPAYRDKTHGPLPVTERVVSRIISLPVVPELSLEGRDAVIAGLRESVEEVGRAPAAELDESTERA
jgi:aminotransferase EvaB